jgi:hypothetical protein
MNVGDTVTLNLPGPAGEERFRIMAVRAVPPPQRGPLKLRLKSKTNGRTIYDFPSSLTTKEEQ